MSRRCTYRLVRPLLSVQLPVPPFSAIFSKARSIWPTLSGTPSPCVEQTPEVESQSLPHDQGLRSVALAALGRHRHGSLGTHGRASDPFDPMCSVQWNRRQRDENGARWTSACYAYPAAYTEQPGRQGRYVPRPSSATDGAAKMSTGWQEA